MTKTFSNLKITLAKHVDSHIHKRAMEKELKERFVTDKTKQDIFNSMLHLSYYSIKSYTAFQQFENLIATAGICGLELGDINHSKWFIVKFMNLVDTCLIKKTSQWAKEQEILTVTLDIGTEYGIPLLAVLFINAGKAKLIDIVPLTSKKGVDVADACFQACTLSDQLDSELLQTKIAGITGDGALRKVMLPLRTGCPNI